MDPHNAVSATPSPDAIDFVRFCYRRRRVGWPELYDEMCAVAGRGLFRGYDADDLAGIGIGFSLFVVVLAALNLILDFDFIDRGIGSAPAELEWLAAFGLVVTLIWLYMEILRLLTKLRR